MPKVIQTQPITATEKTALLKSSTSTSLSDSIRSSSSLSELNVISSITAFRIHRHKKTGICCNISRKYHIRDLDKRELVLTGHQDSACWTNDYEDLLIHDLHDQLMFAVEYEERTGYLSIQMKFTVVSSTKLGIGSVSRIWSFMESPRYEILNWNNEHLFSIGPPKTSGIKSYDYKRKYEVKSNDGRTVANLTQAGREVTLQFDTVEMLHVRDKTLILALAFILDLLRNEEI